MSECTWTKEEHESTAVECTAHGMIDAAKATRMLAEIERLNEERAADGRAIESLKREIDKSAERFAKKSRELDATITRLRGDVTAARDEIERLTAVLTVTNADRERLTSQVQRLTTDYGAERARAERAETQERLRDMADDHDLAILRNSRRVHQRARIAAEGYALSARLVEEGLRKELLNGSEARAKEHAELTARAEKAERDLAHAVQRERPSRMNRSAYATLIAENIAWCEAQPRTLERDHTIMVLRESVDAHYPPSGQPMPSAPDASLEERAVADVRTAADIVSGLLEFVLDREWSDRVYDYGDYFYSGCNACSAREDAGEHFSGCLRATMISEARAFIEAERLPVRAVDASRPGLNEEEARPDDRVSMDSELARAVRDTLGETTHYGVMERIEELLDVEKESASRGDVPAEVRAVAIEKRKAEEYAHAKARIVYSETGFNAQAAERAFSSAMAEYAERAPSPPAVPAEAACDRCGAPATSVGAYGDDEPAPRCDRHTGKELVEERAKRARVKKASLLTGLPEEERNRITTAAERAHDEANLHSTAPLAGETAYYATIASEVAKLRAPQSAPAEAARKALSDAMIARGEAPIYELSTDAANKAAIMEAAVAPIGEEPPTQPPQRERCKPIAGPWTDGVMTYDERGLMLASANKTTEGVVVCVNRPHLSAEIFRTATEYEAMTAIRERLATWCDVTALTIPEAP